MTQQENSIVLKPRYAQCPYQNLSVNQIFKIPINNDQDNRYIKHYNNVL